MEKVIVLGGGESGVGAALLARGKGAEVLVSDYGQIGSQYQEILAANDIPYEMGGHSIASFFDADIVIKSPGIPGNVPVVRELRAKQVPIISEIEYAFRYAQAPIIAITGSNGKTTTTSLIHHLLVAAGVHALLGGNIGNSFAELIAKSPVPEVYVLEISSFQLDDVIDFRPNIALLLNITPDHLDRYHHSLDPYALAKFRIAAKQREEDVFIYSAEDPETQLRLDWNSGKAQQLRFGLDKGNARMQGDQLLLDDGWMFPVTQTQLLGPHNQLNMLAALLAVRAWGVAPEMVVEGLKSFQPIAHRLEPVEKVQGITFINDSKATNVDAAKYALMAMQGPTIWITGGIDKGNDYSVLQPLVAANVKHIIVLGAHDEKIRAAFSQPISKVDSMPAAIALAMSMGEEGDIVLLSPACASFDLFQNYTDRGDQFKAAVKALSSQS